MASFGFRLMACQPTTSVALKKQDDVQLYEEIESPIGVTKIREALDLALVMSKSIPPGRDKRTDS